MVFSLLNTFLSDQETILFESYNAPRHTRIGTNDLTLQDKLCYFQTSEKPKTAGLMNVI